jgi:hypothetical protein
LCFSYGIRSSYKNYNLSHISYEDWAVDY